MTRQIGTAKYMQDYLGVALAALAARLWKTDGDVLVYIAHPPGDVEYRHDLMAACGEEWVVELGGRRTYLNFNSVYTWEEPIGGVMNLLLTEDGLHYKNPEIAEGRTLVIDIGGGTTDLSGVFPDGRLDLSVQESIPIGINDVYRDLERSLRKRYAKFFKNIRQIPPARLREALKTGSYSGGGWDSLDCQYEATMATNLHRHIDKVAWLSMAVVWTTKRRTPC